MAFYCQCGAKLRNVRDKGRTGTKKWLSYKVLFVATKRMYKCPNGCELKEVMED